MWHLRLPCFKLCMGKSTEDRSCNPLSRIWRGCRPQMHTLLSSTEALPSNRTSFLLPQSLRHIPSGERALGSILTPSDCWCISSLILSFQVIGTSAVSLPPACLLCLRQEPRQEKSWCHEVFAGETAESAYTLWRHRGDTAGCTLPWLLGHSSSRKIFPFFNRSIMLIKIS